MKALAHNCKAVHLAMNSISRLSLGMACSLRSIAKEHCLVHDVHMLARDAEQRNVAAQRAPGFTRLRFLGCLSSTYRCPRSDL